MNSNEKWYHQSGEQGDIVISTRVRLARNLSEYPFPHKLATEDKQHINHLIRDALISGNSAIAGDFDYIEMESLSGTQAQSLAEKHLISYDFASNRSGRALLLKKDESVSIMLCEEDHLRIQVMSAGMALQEIYELADKLDTLLDNELHFAFSKHLGYLTGCPTNLGTGMRASLMLHLPMLQAAGSIDALAAAVSKIGLTLRGAYGEGSKPVGALYQLSNQITLGIDEKSAIENLSAIAGQVIAKENEARLATDRVRLEDVVMRSLGVLRYAKILSSREFDEHISNIRMGVSMGIITDVTIERINTIFNDCQPACLAVADKAAEQPEKRDIMRADLVREALK